MKECIELYQTPFENYLNDSNMYVEESFDDMYDELCESYMEMFNHYLDECDVYQEGEILDYATGKGKDDHPVLKVILFLPRLVIAIAKSIHNKIHGNKVQEAVRVATAVAENPKEAMEELVVEAIESTPVDSGSEPTADTSTEPSTQPSYPSAPERFDQSPVHTLTGKNYPNYPEPAKHRSYPGGKSEWEQPKKSNPRLDNLESKERRSSLVDYNGPTKSTKTSVLKPKPAPMGTYQIALPNDALSMAIDVVYMNAMVQHTAKISQASRNLYKELMIVVRDALNGHDIKARDLVNEIGLEFPLRLNKQSIKGSTKKSIQSIGDALTKCDKNLKQAIKDAKAAEKQFKSAKNLPSASQENVEKAKRIVQSIIIPFFSSFTSYSNKVSTCVADALVEFRSELKGEAKEIAKQQSRDRFADQKAIREARKNQKKAGLATNPNNIGDKNFEAGLLGKKKKTRKGVQESFYDDFDDEESVVVEYMI